MAWVIALLVVIAGPVLWALTAGRRGGAPELEDHDGSSGFGAALNERNSGTPAPPNS